MNHLISGTLTTLASPVVVVDQYLQLGAKKIFGYHHDVGKIDASCGYNDTCLAGQQNMSELHQGEHDVAHTDI